MNDTSMQAATEERVRSAGSAPCIAIVAPSLDILGGQGIAARSLAAALTADGFDVLFVPVNPRFPYGMGWLRRIPVLRTLFNQLLYIVSLLRLARADVVHIFSASYWSFLLAPVPALLMARLLGKRSILNYHSGEAQEHLAGWGLRVHPWLRLADSIVVPSQYLQRVFAQHGYATTVVRNIVTTSAFHYRERLPLRPRLLSNRNLEAHYDVGNTLKAFALFQATFTDATLTVAGYGSEAVRLQQWVEALGLTGVSFIGRVEPADMPRIYDEADVFLNSSRVDNQPISILEAFAAGLPVISTPTGDIAAMIDDGVTGILVPPGMPERMAAAIADLLAQPQAAALMARRAAAEAEYYTWPRVGSAWSTVYGRKPL